MPPCLADLSACLIRGGTNAELAYLLEAILGTLVIATFPLLLVIFLIWVERKFAARIQDRIGPNRVGPAGLLQTFADALKLIAKEDITPAGADRVLFNIAPVLSVASMLMMWAAIPFSPTIIGTDLEIGILYIIAVASIGTLAVMMAGWSSNNKYALLGAFRVVAQLVSYEVPLVLSLAIPVLLAGTLSMQELVWAQRGMWFIVMAPVATVIFFLSAQAETGRAPFDLLEAESELVAGFNIEYSGMKFGLFFAGEFAHVLTNGVLVALLFLGGWWGPGVLTFPALGIFYLFFKASIAYLLSLLLRNSVPRIRIDQLMNFNWKFLVPVSIINLLLTALLVKLVQLAGWGFDPANASTLAALPTTLVLLGGNLLLVLGMLQAVRSMGRRERETAANARPLPREDLPVPISAAGR